MKQKQDPISTQLPNSDITAEEVNEAIGTLSGWIHGRRVTIPGYQKETYAIADQSKNVRYVCANVHDDL